MLFIQDELNKVFSIHNNYILEWSFKLNNCNGYIEYQKAEGIWMEDSRIYLINNSSNMTILEGLES